MGGRFASRTPVTEPAVRRGGRTLYDRNGNFGPHLGVKHVVPGRIDQATQKKKKVAGLMSPYSQSSGPDVRAISAGGSGTISSTYTPESDDKSAKIVFIQVMRESLDGVATKPSTIDPSFSYQDADTTSDFYHVDYVSGEKDPYYNGDDPGDIGTQGNAASNPKVPASTNDTPHYRDATFPAGKTKVLWQFRTAAFSATGADAGRYYGYVDWSYEKDKGVPEKTAIAGAHSGGPGGSFEAAVRLWNSNHGFSMPGGGTGVIVGGVMGGLAGAAIGAGIGGAVGGIGGAVVGGLVGLAAGGIAGGLAGRKNVTAAFS